MCVRAHVCVCVNIYFLCFITESRCFLLSFLSNVTQTKLLECWNSLKNVNVFVNGISQQILEFRTHKLSCHQAHITIVEDRDVIGALNARNVSIGSPIWRLTFERTPETNPSNAWRVDDRSQEKVIWDLTSWYTTKSSLLPARRADRSFGCWEL